MPTPPTLPHTVPSPIPPILLSGTRSLNSTSTAASSTQSPAILAAASPSPTARTFSAATVIALSTVLPTIICILLAIVIYLLRARRKPSPCSQSKENSANELPMVDIQRDLENPQSQPPFITLPQSLSPFNMSLHELSKSAVLGGDNRTGRSPSVMTHLSSDSGLAHHSDAQLPTLPAIAHIQPPPPSTPVLAVRYPSKPAAGEPKSGQQASIYVERTSVDSGAASTVVFARERTEDGSTGRVSRDELNRWGSRDARTSLGELPRRPSGAATEPSGRPSASSSDPQGTSETPTAEGHDAHAPGRPTSKGLRLLGVGPSSPYGLQLLARAHLGSRSGSSTTYGLPSLQISPRGRAPRKSREPSSETNTQGDVADTSSGRLQDLDSRAETQRIHPQPPSLPHPPSSTPDTSPDASSSRLSRERQALSITIPPRLGAPILPVAELIAVQSPSPQPTPRTHARHNTPRSHSASRIPGFAGPDQLSVLGNTSRLRGMSDSEPSPETRERVLRLLGRLPENSQGGSESQSGGSVLRVEQPPGVRGADRAREVRRSQSESVLLGAPVQQPSDA
ncbi:hypothetical protein FRC06_006973 [Ceratobasidium sp. 370]|nr:hypothetical protein FRC06_006973 [Ceratobasidium sp. 370]